MSAENRAPEQPEEVPEDATVIRQVQWSWLWSSMPWMLVIFVILYIGFIEEITAAVVTIIIMVPRYFMWRRTEYTLTKEALIYKRGGLTGSQRYPIPISRLKDARARYGFFGRALGYQTVDVVMDNGAVASLQYVPIPAGVAERLKELIEAYEPGQEDGEDGDDANGPPDEPRPYDPDVSRYEGEKPPEDGPTTR